VKHSRSSSVNTAEGSRGDDSFKWRSYGKQRRTDDLSTKINGSMNGKRTSSYQESPLTDVSYVQGSSDGTNGSSKAARAAESHLMDMIPPPPAETPPRDSGFEGNEDMNALNYYDAVAEQPSSKRRSDPNISLLRSGQSSGQRLSVQGRGSKIGRIQILTPVPVA